MYLMTDIISSCAAPNASVMPPKVKTTRSPSLFCKLSMVSSELPAAFFVTILIRRDEKSEEMRRATIKEDSREKKSKEKRRVKRKENSRDEKSEEKRGVKRKVE